MKALLGAFNQEKALVEAFSVITNLRMEIFEALLKEVTAEAVDRGAFGSPTMFFSEGGADTEHMFWGSDRSRVGV